MDLPCASACFSPHLARHARRSLAARILFKAMLLFCALFESNSCLQKDLNGSSPDELSWASFQSHIADGKKVHLEDVYSKSEKALIREAVAEVDMGSANAHAVRFPASAAATAALASTDRLVVLSLDVAKVSLFFCVYVFFQCWLFCVCQETIELVARSAQAGPSDLVEQLQKEPRFAVFVWEHEHGGNAVSSKIFVYYCPETAPVKAKVGARAVNLSSNLSLSVCKMTYSTVKSIAVELAGKVDLKLEVTEVEGDRQETTKKKQREIVF